MLLRTKNRSCKPSLYGDLYQDYRSKRETKPLFKDWIVSLRMNCSIQNSFTTFIFCFTVDHIAALDAAIIVGQMMTFWEFLTAMLMLHYKLYRPLSAGWSTAGLLWMKYNIQLGWMRMRQRQQQMGNPVQTGSPIFAYVLRCLISDIPNYNNIFNCNIKDPG